MNHQLDFTETLEAIPEFDTLEDAVASWVQSAGGVEEVSIWVTPTTKFKVKLPKSAPPTVLIGRLLKDDETGKFWFKPMSWPMLMRTFEAPRRLGLPFESRVLLRLIYAGFVKGCRLTTSSHLVDIESLWQHMQATSGEEGESFWTPDRRRRFNEAVQVVRSGSDKRRGRKAEASN